MLLLGKVLVEQESRQFELREKETKKGKEKQVNKKLKKSEGRGQGALRKFWFEGRWSL